MRYINRALTGLILLLLYGCNANYRIPQDGFGQEFVPQLNDNCNDISDSTIQTEIPGQRPVVIGVSCASQEMISQSTISWGYIGSDGKFKVGGKGSFAHDGGVISGGITRDFSPEVIEISLSVDYANPDIHDVKRTFIEPVRASGVNRIVDVTSIAINTKILLAVHPHLRLYPQDYINIYINYKSVDSHNNFIKSVGILADEIERMKGAPFFYHLNYPLGGEKNGEIEWIVKYRIRNNEGESLSFSSKYWEPNIILAIDRDGVLSLR